MIVVDEPVGFVTADEALLLAQCVDLAIRVTEQQDGLRVGKDDRMRVLLVQLSTVAACRGERVGIPPSGPERTMRTMSVNEVAEILGIGVRAVRARCERRSLRSVKVDGQHRIFADQFEEAS